MVMKQLALGVAFLGINGASMAAPRLADRVPADAIFYASIDGKRLMDGTCSLDLVSLLEEPEVQEFLAPLTQEAPFLATGGLRQLLAQLPTHQFVDGSLEIALRGLRVQLDGDSYDISASNPISARLLNRFGGMAGAMAALENGGSGIPPNVKFAVDFVIGVDAGSGLEHVFQQMIQEAGMEHGSHRIAGRQADRFTLRVPDVPTIQTNLYRVQDGDRWWIGGHPDTLAQCIGRGSAQSLADSKAFKNFMGSVASEDPSILVYVNAANACRIFEKFIPPIVMEEMELAGLTSVESLGFASSFVNGGVRDSIAVSYGDKPKGLLSLLDCSDQRFDFIRHAPAETGLYVGANVDAEGMLHELLTAVGDLFPGSEAGIEQGLIELEKETGVDFRHEVLPAFGSELGIYLTAPGGSMGLLPEGMVMIEVGDRTKFEKLLEMGMAVARNEGIQFTQIKSMPGNFHGYNMMIPGAPVQPALAVGDDYLALAMNALSLRTSLRAMEEGKRQNSVVSNESFRKVMEGLDCNKDSSGLSFLAFADLRSAVRTGYQFLPMAAAAISAETDGMLDLGLMPGADVVAKHFSGIGIAGRSDHAGMSFSIFSPTGLPSMALAGFAAEARQVRGHRGGGQQRREIVRADRASGQGQGSGQGQKEAGFLGIVPGEGSGGVEIASTVEGAPAAGAGIRAGDVIVGVDGDAVADLDGFLAVLQQKHAGDVLDVEVNRDGKSKQLSVTLGSRSRFVDGAAVVAEPQQVARAEPKRKPASKSRGKEKSLGQLFQNIENALDVTIMYPASMEEHRVRYSPKSADLETMLAELSELVGFDYQIRAAGGASLVEIRAP